MENVVTEGKKKCEICGKIKRKKCFKFNILYRKLVCNRCDKQKGNNRWFIPKEQRKEVYAKRRKFKRVNRRYNINEQEKKFLHQQLVKGGLTSEKAWERIKNDKEWMREKYFELKIQRLDKIKMDKEEQKKEKEQMKKLIKKFAMRKWKKFHIC